MLKILFFTTALEHTTFRKTAQMLKRTGAYVQVVGFTRNNFPEGDSDLNVESLGNITHGSYFKRIMKLIRLLPFIREKAKDFDVIYTFTLDTLIICKLALLFKKKTWVYQIQDIRPIYFGDSIKNKLARYIEAKFVRKIDLLVVSSENYYTGYYKPFYKVDEQKVVVIENKIIKDTINPLPDSLTDDSKLTIGYFGVMRCVRSWEILKSFVSVNPERFELYLRGKPAAIDGIENQISSFDNIRYGGVYKSPDQLNDLYNRVDIVWAAYPFSELKEGNWKYARTIRFYEACAFGKPVIVQKGTPQATDVERYDLGLVVDMGDVQGTKDVLSSLNRNQLANWKRNIEKLDSSFYTHADEYSHLLTKIRNLANQK